MRTNSSMHRDSGRLSAMARRSDLLLAAVTILVPAVGCRPTAGTLTAVPVRAEARLVSTIDGTTIPVSTLVERLDGVRVLFFGEQHGDSATHRLEAQLLAAVGAISRPVVLSLEMFERDVQPVIDAYLAGAVDEAGFLAEARPWPRFATDYRPLVELAREHGWPVVAANVPRPIASAVGRRGLAAVDSLDAREREHVARDISCPADAYRTRFLQSMRAHPAGGQAPGPGDTLATAAAERFYLAQCVKDETMAESIARALAQAPDAIVLHFTGAFHSDFGHGTVERVRRRIPAVGVAIVSTVKVTDPTRVEPAEYSSRADYVLFVPGN
jgi:uncharacterized iron-regulated protein